MKTQTIIFTLIGVLTLFSCSNPTNKEKTNTDKVKPSDIIKAEPVDTILYGIDISKYQGRFINEEIPKGKIQFAICKATQGVSFIDSEFHLNWIGIPAKGLIRGAYHFYVCSDDPITQAEHFSKTIGDVLANDIAPVLDIEQGSMSNTTNVKQMQKDILVFLEKVETLTGRKPILYTDYAFAQQYLRSQQFAKYDLWLAEYSGATRPKVPDTWKFKGFKIWQKADNHSLNSQQVDFDVHFGTAEELTK